MSIEALIFDNLTTNEDYARAALPFLTSEYFHEYCDKVIFEIINSYITEYNSIPSKAAIKIELDNRTDLSDEQYIECKEKIAAMASERDQLTKKEWLLEQTEKFCQDKALYNAILESIKIIDDKNGKFDKGTIPQILTDALSISFDTNIGHDFIDDADERYEFYHRKEERIPFDIDYLNKITKGGLPRKTFSVLLASTGVGKSLLMCHMAAANLCAGLNVLYITLELSEEKVSERIDANLLNIPLDDLRVLPYESYRKKIDKLSEKITGKLIVKEYPTSCAGSANFRHLLNELKLKKNFIPDIIYIDYLNLCASSRIKNNGTVGSYFYIKAIAEELRGLAVEFDVAVVSATQTNKSGYSSDINITHTSESMGVPATADLMLAIVFIEELQQYMIIQLKNRHGDIGIYNKFVVGVDKSKMRIYNTEQSAQDDISNDKPAFDNSSSYEKMSKKFDTNKFDGFK